MKVLLISAPSRTSLPAYTLPFNVMYLASYIRQHGHEVEILDAAKEKPTATELATQVKIKKPDLIGIGGIVTTFNYIQAATNEIRRICPDIPIVIGGQVALVKSDLIFKTMGCDYIAHGYGEKTLDELAKALEKGQPVESIPGLSFKENGTIIKNASQPFTKNLDEIPYPAYDLVDLEYYIAVIGKICANQSSEYLKRNNKKLKNMRAIGILASRGCIAKCTFCIHEDDFCGLWQHSVDYLIKHIEYLHQEYDIGFFHIGEEMFFPNHRKVREFVSIMNERFPDVYYGCSSRANLLTKEYVRELEKGNCVRAGYGFETGSQTMLDLYNKNVTREQNIAAYKNLSMSKISCKVTLMVGGVGETYKTIKETINAVNEAKMVSSNAGMFITTPYPGSRLYEWCLQQGLIADQEEYLKMISGHDADTPIVNMTVFPKMIVRLMRIMVYSALEKNEEKYKESRFSLTHKLIRWILVPLAFEMYFICRSIFGRFIKKYKRDTLHFEVDIRKSLKLGA